MVQQEAVSKAYESLVFMMPRLKAKYRNILIEHLAQVYVVGYEFGLKKAPKCKAILQLEDDKIINRFPDVYIASKQSGKGVMTIRDSIKRKTKDRTGYTWKYSNIDTNDKL